MTAKSKMLPTTFAPPEVSAHEPPVAEEPQAASKDAEEGGGSPSALKFALIWFGIPILFVLLVVFVRMQCSIPS